MSNGFGNVVFQRGQERSVGPGSGGEPGRVLVVPVQVVAPDQLAIGFGDSDKFVSACKVEHILLWLDKLPLSVLLATRFMFSICWIFTFMMLAGVS